MTDSPVSTIARCEFTAMQIAARSRHQLISVCAREKFIKKKKERRALEIGRSPRVTMFNSYRSIIMSAGGKSRSSFDRLKYALWKFRNVIYSSSMSAEMSAPRFHQVAHLITSSPSQHCRATMYYNPSWSPRRDSDEFLLFSHRRHGGTLCQRQNFARFRWCPASPQANQW